MTIIVSSNINTLVFNLLANMLSLVYVHILFYGHFLSNTVLIAA